MIGVFGGDGGGFFVRLVVWFVSERGFPVLGVALELTETQLSLSPNCQDSRHGLPPPSLFLF